MEPTNIKYSTIVRCDKKFGYEFIKNNFVRFPEFVSNIKKLKLLRELSSNKRIVEWMVNIDGANVHWKEENVFNDEDFSMFFNMIEGDFSKYEGKWLVENVLGVTKISISIMLDWGIPNLGKYVGPVLERKAKINTRSMLWAIRKRLNKLALMRNNW
ncbi:MAG: SRPBCC family protein [Candidatus Omnitrophota bacterium]